MSIEGLSKHLQLTCPTDLNKIKFGQESFQMNEILN